MSTLSERLIQLRDTVRCRPGGVLDARMFVQDSGPLSGACPAISAPLNAAASTVEPAIERRPALSERRRRRVEAPPVRRIDSSYTGQVILS